MAEVECDPGHDTEIVLTIVYGVGDATIDPVDLTERQADPWFQLSCDASACQYSEGIPINRELEVDVFFCTAKHSLCVWNEAA